MAAPEIILPKINQINTGSQTYDINAKYWNGSSTLQLKTVNGVSVKGTGNVVTVYKLQNHYNENSTQSNPCDILPNIFHVWGVVSSLFINLSTNGVDATYGNEYIFEFQCGSTATTLTLPNIKWANGVAPNLEPNTTYQISILNNCGTIVAFKEV